MMIDMILRLYFRDCLGFLIAVYGPKQTQTELGYPKRRGMSIYKKVIQLLGSHDSGYRAPISCYCMPNKDSPNNKLLRV